MKKSSVFFAVIFIMFSISPGFSQTAEDYMDKAFEGYKSKNLEITIINLTKAIELEPGLLLAYLCRGRTYSDLNEYDKALADYNTAIGLDSSSSGAYMLRGNLNSELKNYNLAEQDYSKSIFLDAGNNDAYYFRGLFYAFTVNKFEKAIDDLNKYIENDTMSYYAFKGRGYSYMKISEYNQALPDLDKAIILNPDDAGSYTYRAMAKFNIGDEKGFCEDLQTAVKLGDQIAIIMIDKFCK